MNQETPSLPDIPGDFDDFLFAYMVWTGAGNIEDDLWLLLPPPEIWPWRYVIEYDEVNGHRYYRVPHEVEDDLTTDPQDWIELTGGLTDVNGNPSSTAFEILTFMSQANAEPVGVQALQNWFDEWNDIRTLGLDQSNETSVYYSKHRWNHSFQFHHDAAATWAFWQQVKNETNFRATY